MTLEMLAMMKVTKKISVSGGHFGHFGSFKIGTNHQLIIKMAGHVSEGIQW